LHDTLHHRSLGTASLLVTRSLFFLLMFLFCSSLSFSHFYLCLLFALVSHF
jgi:hypothetical protein